MRQWMYNLYREKDQLLAEYYRTGAFPYRGEGQPDGQPPLEVRHDPMRFLGLHAAYLSASYISYSVLSPFIWPLVSLVW